MSSGKVLAGAGLRGQVAGETSLSTVGAEGVGLTYRGYRIEDLAEHATFEEVAALLIDGELPTQSQLDQFRAEIAEYSELAPEVRTGLEVTPASASPMDVLRTAISIQGTLTPESADFSDQRTHAIRLLGTLPSALAYWYRFHTDGVSIDTKSAPVGIAAQFLNLLHGNTDDSTKVRALDVSFIIYAEHEFNASTFTGRIIASTLSDIYSAVAGAIGALRGPLHGGANEDAKALIDSFSSVEHAITSLDEMFAVKAKVPGFGHAIYSSNDPRSDIISPWANKLAKSAGLDEKATIFAAVEKHVFASKKLCPNVDYYMALAYQSLGLATPLFTPLFALARTSGWCAHIVEQRANNRIIRPSSDYIGESERDWVPVANR